MAGKPYTYYICWTQMNRHYIGVRTANVLCAADDLWSKYKTSSKYVWDFIEKHGDPDYIETWEHNSEDEAKDHEYELFNRISVSTREVMLNKHFGHATNNKPLSEEQKQIIRERMTGRKVGAETRERLRIANTGNKHTEATKQLLRQQSMNAPHLKKPKTEAHKKKLSEANKGRKVKDSTRKKLSEATKRYWEKKKANGQG